MGNTVTRVIHGCPVPEDDQDLQELCRESSVCSLDVGWHDTYDQNQDVLWFGVTVSSIQNEYFSDLPGPAPKDVARAVQDAWDNLPEEIRSRLPRPKTLMLTVRD